MVIRLAVILCLIVTNVFAGDDDRLTLNDIHRWNRLADQAAREKNNRKDVLEDLAKDIEIDDNVPERITSIRDVKTNQSINNNDDNLVTRTKRSDSVANTSTPAAAQPKVPPGHYVPPPRYRGEDPFFDYKRHQKKKTTRFGIRKGTWMRVRLERYVSNVDSGDVELVLDETVYGERRDLPAGTLFFAKKRFNRGLEKLNLTVTDGITPNDTEFSIRAIAADIDKVNGLPGRILHDRKGEVTYAMAGGLLDVGYNVVDEIGGGVVTDGVKNAADELIRNEGKRLRRKQVPVFKVDPQRLYLRVDESF